MHPKWESKLVDTIHTHSCCAHGMLSIKAQLCTDFALTTCAQLCFNALITTDHDSSTDLQVCKHFLHAIEKAVYGWFWECPNGEKCIYRHALPPGFVFKKVQKEAVQEETITMEELVEREVCVCVCVSHETCSKRKLLTGLLKGIQSLLTHAQCTLSALVLSPYPGDSAALLSLSL